MNPKIQNILEKSVSYILLGMVVIGLIIMYAVSKASTFNWGFFIIGLLLSAVPTLGFLIYSRISESKVDNSHKKYLKELKKCGIRIDVLLSDCELKSNKWSYQKDRTNDSRIQFLNGISGHSDKNIETVTVENSVLLYKAMYKGKMRTFKSNVIAKDEITLRMLLELQKTTSIIVDPKNPKHYYFNLEFLDN